jgi:hypothetical protein
VPMPIDAGLSSAFAVTAGLAVVGLMAALLLAGHQRSPMPGEST